jgi:hypothetical protein
MNNQAWFRGKLNLHNSTGRLDHRISRSVEAPSYPVLCLLFKGCGLVLRFVHRTSATCKHATKFIPLQATMQATGLEGQMSNVVFLKCFCFSTVGP